eukprot:Gregarina_sp_Poly_1__9533@NODE_5_length_25086_cov_86_244454_g4_i0_p5_GENE_NODE_5_length_25086_cov_86_244454_g4_i0NODE_5_length_25086_cov_86_244454_g4_i0_p5_ORF_typecomplete_len235_score31_66Pribosyltran/PF00156_27/3e21Pribosyl_synth/PF14572_6/1_7e05UPRTase/PF14681_6/0_00079MctB/PF11382_8/0_087PRTase_2/PF15609_6/0_11_NODE_5_length_25086_cov_86_244454_g4_i056306334
MTETPSTMSVEEELGCRSNVKKFGIFIPDGFQFSTDSVPLPAYYKPYLAKVLLPAGLLEERIQKMALDILNDRPRDRPLHLVCVLKSASVFYFKLSEQLRILSALSLNSKSPMYFEEFVRVSSYTNKESGEMTVSGMAMEQLKDKDVLVVEDMVDTGNTLTALVARMQDAGAASVSVATLLVKRLGRNTFQPDYVGFSIPNEFVVGFGIDYNQHFRDMPPLCVVNKLGESKFAA